MDVAKLIEVLQRVENKKAIVRFGTAEREVLDIKGVVELEPSPSFQNGIVFLRDFDENGIARTQYPLLKDR